MWPGVPRPDARTSRAADDGVLAWPACHPREIEPGSAGASPYRHGMDRCDECAYRYDGVAVTEIPDLLVALAGDYRVRLRGAPSTQLRAHPLAATWSALEYGCHVRDVLGVQHERIRRAQVEDCPEFEPMGRDERVTRDRYNRQAPHTVADELGSAAASLAETLRHLDDRAWQRPCVYSWPARSRRTIAWMARHTVHEAIHHRRDVDRVLAAARPGPSR